MNTKKMRAYAPLLPPPGGDVVCECLDEIERLRFALRDIHDEPDGARLKAAKALMPS
jgi:hypothetical protein